MNPTTPEIECVVAGRFGWRQNIVVPNVHWGLNLHECDLLIISKTGYATEVEIKISKTDLKKDAEKKHGHKSDMIKHLYFAIPEKLLPCIDLIPAHAGIFVVKAFPEVSQKPGWPRFYADTLRHPETNNYARKLTEKEIQKALHLGCMRIWNLKEKLNNKCLALNEN